MSELKYKVGDKFIVEIKEVLDGDNGTLYRSNFSTLVFDDYGLDKLQKYEDTEYAEGVKEGLASFNCEVKKAYDKGLQDAWELARKINDMPNSKMQEIFDISEDVIEVEWELFNNFTPQQALAKIEAYEKSQQIQVGDVVYIDHVANDELEDEEKTEQITKLKTEAVQSLPVVSNRNVEYLSKPEFEKEFAKITKSNEIVDSTHVYEEAIAYDKSQIEDTIFAIADKEYKMPDGSDIKFISDDGKPINVQLAISRLQNGISMWQADTGDVGESSKVFTLLAMYIKADQTAGGMGVTEWMIMVFIFITGIIQECMIALCTPSATIDRGTLLSVSRYCLWKDEEEKNKFLLKVYKSYVGDGVFSQEDYEAKCKKCVELMEETEEDVINRYTTKVNETVNMDFTALKDAINKAKEIL